MYLNHPETPKTELAIAALLKEHKDCDFKTHTLVVTAEKQIKLRHRRQTTNDDTVIAKLSQKDVRTGFTAKKWFRYCQSVIAVLNDQNACAKEKHPSFFK